MRNTPVIIFVNKMDREGKDPFDLLDELEEELMIQVRPLSWPIEQGPVSREFIISTNRNWTSINLPNKW